MLLRCLSMSAKRPNIKNAMQLAMEAAAKKKAMSLATNDKAEELNNRNSDRLGIIRKACQTIAGREFIRQVVIDEQSEKFDRLQIKKNKNLTKETRNYKSSRKNSVNPRSKSYRFEDGGVSDAYHPGVDKRLSRSTGRATKNVSEAIQGLDIVFTEETRISEELLVPDFSFQMAFDYSSSNRDQVSPIGEIDTDVIMGIDWGTTYTKVIIQELGSRKAFAVKFGRTGIDGYLLPSQIYKNGNTYGFTGPEVNLKKNLKLPILNRDYDVNDLSYIIAFLAVVIRNAREWFLINHGSIFNNAKLAWSYHIGVPAVRSDIELGTLVRNILHSAAAISLTDGELILGSDVLRAANIVKQGSWFDENRVLDEYYVSAFPEISAQLHGYVSSNKWDDSLPKVMIIDIGGGTVDSAIINVTKNRSEVRYNCLKSHVFNCGAEILHLKRQAWIEGAFANSKIKNPPLLKELELMRRTSGKLSKIPSSVTHYLSQAVFPENSGNNVDTVFDRKYAMTLSASVIIPVRIIDPRTDWSKLKVLFCGGASNNKVYQHYINRVNSSDNRSLRFNLATLEAPENLDIVGVESCDYHRLSVAFGLSFQDLGEFVGPDEIPPIPSENEQTSSAWNVEYISKDFV